MLLLNTRSGVAERTVIDRRRLDIQGLRTVALVLVVAIHARLPVPFGFVGLDMYFVISGFVITGMINHERSSTGHFRFGRFYLRRFKRLTPALALMVAVTMILSFCLLSPFGIQQLAAQTGVGALLLAANFVVTGNNTQYFDFNSMVDSNPLVHTWSLSVEEQFYFAFPAILVLGYALSQRGRRIPWTPVIVGGTAAISFWLFIFGGWALGPLAPWADYLVGPFGPLARWWEVAIGALLALATTKRSLVAGKHAGALAWLGAALLAASACIDNDPFPNPWRIIPIAGTLVLIAAGTHHTTWVNRALAHPAMVKVGDLSYSIYLWHWPLITFAVYLWPRIPYVAVIAAALSILPALASYRWVEQPFRRVPPLSRFRTGALVAAVISPALFLAATVDLAAQDFWVPEYQTGTAATAREQDADWADFLTHYRATYYPCTDQAILDAAPKWKGIARCWQSKPDPPVDVALIGDSHAEQLFLGLAEALPSKNVAYYIQYAPPVRSIAAVDRIVDHVASDPAISTVIVNANWALHGVSRDELASTFQALTSKSKAVFVTDGVPTFSFDPVACKYRVAPLLPLTECSEDRASFDSAYAAYYPELRAAVDKVPGVQLLNTAQYFCNAKVCSVNRDNAILYRDRYHLNDVGSRFLVRELLADSPQFMAALKRSQERSP
jgi:peptidoglycan/LPS O-acetylase OafA/YrhL